MPIRDEAAALFYSRLFELDPSLRPQFIGDAAEQSRKWGAIMSIAVANLERPFILLPTLYTLGAQQEKTAFTSTITTSSASHYSTPCSASWVRHSRLKLKPRGRTATA